MYEEMGYIILKVMNITRAGVGGPDATIPFGGVDLMLMVKACNECHSIVTASTGVS